MQNIFLSGKSNEPNTWNAYVADLGLSLQLTPPQLHEPADVYLTSDVGGTLFFIPPEVRFTLQWTHPLSPFMSFICSLLIQDSGGGLHPDRIV